MTTRAQRLARSAWANTLPAAPSYRALVTSLLALAALVRFYNLGVSSLWYDEGFSAFVASEPLPDLIAHTARDIHPPLYYLLLHGWRQVAGGSDFALAYFSLFFGVLSVALVVCLGGRWFGRTTSLFAGLAAALSPFQIWYSQEVRMYTLAAFLGLLTLGFLARGERRDLVLYAAAAAAGLSVVYYTAFLIIAVNIVMLAWLLAARRLPGAWTVPRWIGAQTLVLFFYLPWLPVALRQALAPPVPPWREFTPPGGALAESFAVLAVGQIVEPSPSLLILVAGLVLFGLAAVPSSHLRLPVVLCAAAVAGPVLLIIAVSFVIPLYHPRYLFPFSLPFSLLLGLGLARLTAASRPLGVVATSALVVGVAGAVHAYHVDDRVAPDDYRAAVAFLAERWQPGDGIVINAGYVYAPFVHYWPGLLDWRGRLTDPAPAGTGVIVYQTGTIDGPPTLGGGDPQADFYSVSWAETEAALQRIAARHPRLWLLRGYDTVTDPSGRIRRWLEENGLPFEDAVFRGPSNIRVQGWVVAEAPPATVVSTDGPVALGFTSRPLAAVGGGEARVSLAWRAAGRLEWPLRAYLALVDDAGRIWMQQDAPAVGTAWGAASWPTNRWVPDPRTLRIPAGVPPGEYRLEVGAYFVGGPALQFETAAGRAPRVSVSRLNIGRATGLPDPRVDIPIGRPLAAGLELVGADFGQFEAREGETLSPVLIWRATKAAPMATLALRLVMADGSVAAATAGEPVSGKYPLRDWQAGELVRDPRTLTIAAGAEGIGRLEVSAGNGWVKLAEVRVEPRQRRFDVPALGQPAGARLGEVAELVAFALVEGRPARVTLVWRALGRTETSYTVFVQALDAADRVVAQSDLPPRGGEALTTSWLPGEVIVDEVALAPRPDTPAGVVRVIMGLYDQRTGVRLRQANGQDYVDLGTIRFP